MKPFTQETQPLTTYEQRLRDEVVYLHSLWHQGPPLPSQNPNPFPYPFYHHIHNNPSSRNLLYVSNPTPFKPIIRNKHRKPKKKKQKTDPQPDPIQELPINQSRSSSPSSTSGWPAFKPNSSSLTRDLSVLDQGKVMQNRVVRCCSDFFSKRVDLGSDGDEEFEEGNDDDGGDADIEESEEFKFLSGLFVKNQELRDFYEKNRDSGEFYCLVCGGIGVKVWKTFKGCLALVQHATAISKTKRKRSHEAFGQVICRVLGWDISMLPMIVLKGKPLSRSFSSSGQAHNCSKENDGDKLVEDLDNVVSTTEASKKGHVDYKGIQGSEPFSDL